MSKTKSGVYKIECVELKSVFIGQSRNVPSRMRNHRMNLKDGIYVNSKSEVLRSLQCDWNLPTTNFIFKQTYEGTDLNVQEERAISDYIASGYKVYNMPGHNVVDFSCPDQFKSVLTKMIGLLSENRITVLQLEGIIEQIENHF